MIVFEYRLAFKDGAGEVLHHRIALDRETLEQVREGNAPLPDWARLEVARCAGCRLESTAHPYCPVAVSLVELVEKFGGYLSYAEVAATVCTAQRTYSTQTTAQKALSSMLGLMMATSGCPTLSPLKPMARFHLPFATREETTFRSASAHLLGQYFSRREGRDADRGLDRLSALYADIHRLNRSMADRLRHASTGDAHLNAIVLLDLFAQELPLSISDGLSSLAPMYRDAAERPGSCGE